MVPIITIECPKDKYSVKCPYTVKPTRIVIHNTANDASAANEVAYMHRNNNKVSFHFAVDDVEIIQALPLDRNSWNASDGRNGKGNREGIAIEICYSKSGGEKWLKAVHNAAELTAKLLKDYGWGIDKVTKHQDYSGKHCPHRILDEYGWDNFINLVKGHLAPSVVETPKVETSAPIKTPIIASNIKEGDIVKVNEGAKDYNGKKIASFVYKSTYKVDELKGDRAVLDKNGICTAFKVKDLTTVKSTKVKVETPKPIVKPTTPTTNYFPKYNGKSNSFVDALKSLGINSALSYRGKIAQANGVIKNSALYIGLKSHNEKMFALLKQGKLIKP